MSVSGVNIQNDRRLPHFSSQTTDCCGHPSFYIRRKTKRLLCKFSSQTIESRNLGQTALHCPPRTMGRPPIGGGGVQQRTSQRSVFPDSVHPMEKSAGLKAPHCIVVKECPEINTDSAQRPVPWCADGHWERLGQMIVGGETAH